MAKKNYESYLKMMGLEIANPSYPKNSIVIEIESTYNYGFARQIHVSDFVNVEVGYVCMGYRSSYTTKLITNTADSTGDMNYTITKIKQSGVKKKCRLRGIEVIVMVVVKIE